MENMSLTDRKINLLRSVEYSNDFELLSSTLIKWNELKPNDTTSKLIDANLRMFYYTFNMEEELRIVRNIVSEYRCDKNRAVERARLADLKIRELEKKLNTNLKL